MYHVVVHHHPQVVHVHVDVSHQGQYHAEAVETFSLIHYSMVPIKRTVFLLTVYGMKNTVCLIGTLEYAYYLFDFFPGATLLLKT